MAERPDSPTPEKPEEIAPEEQPTVHHVSQRKKRKKGVGGEDMQLNLTSMIDVIFQLLIYFVITANFQIDEGTILATLPGNAAQDRPIDTPPKPVVINMVSTDDGVTYTMVVDNQYKINTASQLYGHLKSRADAGEIDRKEDPIQITPMGVVRWQHVVNVFNACVKAELEQVGFAPS